MENKEIRVKHVRYKNIDELTFYEKWRLILSTIQIIATLGVPFVMILINEYMRARM